MACCGLSATDASTSENFLASINWLPSVPRYVSSSPSAERKMCIREREFGIFMVTDKEL